MLCEGDGFNVFSFKTCNSASSMLQCSTIADELGENRVELFERIRNLEDFKVKLHINPNKTYFPTTSTIPHSLEVEWLKLLLLWQVTSTWRSLAQHHRSHLLWQLPSSRTLKK